ncbi:GAF domain-containing protein [Ferrimonas balearica]|uniref:GAF domain-containing protein n=1 Tax=Ferrimonas balearica TaxID=44012 RepID=UPI001C998E4A|nr:GAF domain-containing protein [Ferrimonas balearica]MBY5920456.1 GAF domain-containing protein [Ferrimonas balearica]MBY5996859.1 GAF domain-containing protein [Ferrimonas balearica]
MSVHTPVDYSSLLAQAKALTEGEPSLIANLSNLSALIYHGLGRVNWAGFYLTEGRTLVLGPFQGNVACVRIPWGKGVCGTAAETRSVQRIEDVHRFDGHIACDAASNSEIVLPILVEGEVVAVLDIDSPEFGRFSEADQAGLEPIAELISACFAAAK